MYASQTSENWSVVILKISEPTVIFLEEKSKQGGPHFICARPPLGGGVDGEADRGWEAPKAGVNLYHVN